MKQPPKPHSDNNSVCLDYPDFDRLNYYHGQLLGAKDFETEQNFFRNKMKMLNRCLHGYGVVCGLKVTGVEGPAPAAQKKDDQQQQYEQPDPTPTLIEIGCGLALDQQGNELAIRQPLCVDLWKELQRTTSEHDLPDAGKPCTVWVSLCYHEEEIQQTKTTHAECSNYWTYAKLRDSVCAHVSVEPPTEDKRCEPCCERPDERCVLLARIENFVPGTPIAEGDIYNEARRLLSLYVPTTITGINWDHGRWYSQDEAEQLLPEYGKGADDDVLEIRFSRAVRVDSISPGIVDVWKTDDWTGPSSGDFSHLSTKFQLPDTDLTDTLKVKVLHRGFGDDERVLIIVRTDFILDACGRPVDGNHVGGQVPNFCDPPSVIPLANVREKRGLYGPWHSGNGVPGGTFESWFFVGEEPNDEEPDDEYKKKTKKKE